MASPVGGWICIRCGFHGQPMKVTKGSFGVELLLWLFFCLPGLIYSIWRLTSRYDACPSCLAPSSMIPANSPEGQRLLAMHQASTPSPPTPDMPK